MPYTDEQIAGFPGWLQKLIKMAPEARTAAGYTDEDIDQAAKAFHIDKDYTQKSQEAAELRKALAGMSPEDAAKTLDWWQKNQGTVNELWQHRDRLKAPQSEPEKPRNGNGARRSYRDADASALYETASMRELFESAEDSAFERAEKARVEWYEKQIAPNWDQRAAGMFATALDWIDWARDEAIQAGRDPKYTPLSTQDVIRYATVNNERDIRKAAAGLRQERLGMLKPVQDDAYKRGVEEGIKKAQAAAEGPTGPMGASNPNWRASVPQERPKNSQELRERVLATVEKKYGTQLPR